MIAPVLEELSKEYADKAVVIKVRLQIFILFGYIHIKFNSFSFLQVDVDECEDVAMEFNISSMPTFVFIKNKQKLEEFAGANAEKLATTIGRLV